MKLTDEAKAMIEKQVARNDGYYFEEGAEWALTNPELLAAQGLVQIEGDELLDFSNAQAAIIKSLNETIRKLTSTPSTERQWSDELVGEAMEWANTCGYAYSKLTKRWMYLLSVSDEPDIQLTTPDLIAAFLNDKTL